MASLYQRKNGTYYLSVAFQGKRQTRSLQTKSKEIAKKLIPSIEKEIMIELINGKQKKDLPFKELAKRYLEYDHNWRASTLRLNTYKLKNYLQNGYPKNKTTKAMMIRIINGCNKWGKEHGLINSYQRIKGGSDYDPRDRVLTKDELKILFDSVTPYHFNQFIRFAYYTGARSGEIRRI